MLALLPAQYYRDFDQHLSEFMGPNPETGINLDLTLVGGAGGPGGADVRCCCRGWHGSDVAGWVVLRCVQGSLQAGQGDLDSMLGALC